MLSLGDSVTKIPKVGPYYKQKLDKLGVKTVRDLLYHVPTRYLDFSVTADISLARVGETLTVRGTLEFAKSIRTKKGRLMQIAELTDKTGSVNLVWFNQPYITRLIYPNKTYSVAGTVEWFGHKKAIYSPLFEETGVDINTGRILPIYPETKGLTSRWLRGRVAEVLNSLEEINDSLPSNILTQYHLEPLKKALNYIHHPTSNEDIVVAKRRLAFEELLLLHLTSIERKREWQKIHTRQQIKINTPEIEKFIQSLPYRLTNDQIKVYGEILADMTKNIPANRLLQGDVGSGKTVVAGIAILAAFLNGYQSVVMAPTQILAEQHYQTLTDLFAQYKLRISLITSTTKKIDLGRADLIIGTHSLIHKFTDFDNVALVVIDEQHKFGVEQRTHLLKKTTQGAEVPHILTMTATPIPRTIALTLYGDMDLSVIKESPKGRILPTTWVIPQVKETDALAWVEKTIIQEQIQAFVIAPFIDDSEFPMSAEVASVEEKFPVIQKTLTKIKVAKLHSRLPANQKQQILEDFRHNKIQLLVSTPIVEVGVDIPNANIMLIMSAERFGLASLHQLRGRVGRGEKKSYCILVSSSTSEKTTQRLEAIKTAKSGFELAEMDLKMRGPGEIFGATQAGESELKIASWQDVDLIKQTKTAAENLTNSPQKYHQFLAQLSEKTKN